MKSKTKKKIRKKGGTRLATNNLPTIPIPAGRRISNQIIPQLRSGQRLGRSGQRLGRSGQRLGRSGQPLENHSNINTPKQSNQVVFTPRQSILTPKNNRQTNIYENLKKNINRPNNNRKNNIYENLKLSECKQICGLKNLSVVVENGCSSDIENFDSIDTREEDFPRDYDNTKNRYRNILPNPNTTVKLGNIELKLIQKSIDERKQKIMEKKTIDLGRIQDLKLKLSEETKSIEEEIRVFKQKLQEKPTSNSYINANYISNFDENKNYIAAMGPLAKTMGDFWNMICQNNVSVIIMVTNLVEPTKDIYGNRIDVGKCAKYWPCENFNFPAKNMNDCGVKNNEISTYNLKFKEIVKNYSLKYIDEQSHPGYLITNIKYKNPFTNEEKNLVHYWYKQWPDFGVPNDISEGEGEGEGAPKQNLIQMIKELRNNHPKNELNKWLVHCSAGVGRTGTIIGIDMGLDEACKNISEECTAGLNTEINTEKIIVKLRESRGHMVQKPEQADLITEIINKLLLEEGMCIKQDANNNSKKTKKRRRWFPWGRK